jgi:hypothetical protein
MREDEEHGPKEPAPFVPAMVIIRNHLGCEVDRFEVGAACDPVAAYAAKLNVPLVRLRQAGYTSEVIPQESPK